MNTKLKNKRVTPKASDEPWKGKTPSQRLRDEGQSGGDKPVIGFQTVSVKLRPEEKAELKRVCETLGITPNKAMRVMARKASGFLELDVETIKNMKTIMRQLIGVSRNINQIAKAANRTHEPEYLAFMEDRLELGKEMNALMRLLQDVTLVATRRTDGLSKLKEASES